MPSEDYGEATRQWKKTGFRVFDIVVAGLLLVLSTATFIGAIVLTVQMLNRLVA